MVNVDSLRRLIKLISRYQDRSRGKKEGKCRLLISESKKSIIIDHTEIIHIIKVYHKQIYANKLENLGKANKFLEEHSTQN